MKDLSFLKTNIIAHRGVHIDVPENSLAAFKIALKKNYIIEFDVHLLKDNKIVVFHDDNLKRMTGIDKKLKDCTYKEIKNLKLLNSNESIPTLKEVLELINGQVPIIVELKYDRKTGLLEKELVKQLDKYNGSFCVKSFNPSSIRWFKKNRPNYIRGLLVKLHPKKLKEKLVRSKLMMNLCKPDFLSCNCHFYDNKKLKKYMKKLPILAWTIKNENDYLKYKDKFYNLILDVYNKEKL